MCAEALTQKNTYKIDLKPKMQKKIKPRTKIHKIMKTNP